MQGLVERAAARAHQADEVVRRQRPQLADGGDAAEIEQFAGVAVAFGQQRDRHEVGGAGRLVRRQDDHPASADVWCAGEMRRESRHQQPRRTAHVDIELQRFRAPPPDRGGDGSSGGLRAGLRPEPIETAPPMDLAPHQVEIEPAGGATHPAGEGAADVAELALCASVGDRIGRDHHQPGTSPQGGIGPQSGKDVLEPCLRGGGDQGSLWPVIDRDRHRAAADGGVERLVDDGVEAGDLQVEEHDGALVGKRPWQFRPMAPGTIGSK
jgi:hypothetical protein